MRLSSSNGNSVALLIEGYQFPATTGMGTGDWDANWLTVSGEVHAGDLHWSFRDPSMTTWEARDLAHWLRDVMTGSIEAAPHENNSDVGAKFFTEPNIAFNLAERTHDGVLLRVYLSIEAGPPTIETAIFEYFVELALSKAQVSAALEEWEMELRAVPVRP